MGVIKKATVPDSSIGVDVGQPLNKKNNEIIANISTQNNLQATKIPVNSGQGVWKLSRWMNCMTQFIHPRYRL